MSERTIDDVIARFERSFPPEGDDKGHFHGVYYRNTLAVKDDLERGAFLDPAWLERWDVIFADLYLDALDRWNAGEPPSGPWQVAFQAADGPRIAPLIHTLVGLNAHLNYDLPQALLAVVTDDEFADPELIRRRHADFAHIDEIVVARVKEEDFELRKVELPGDRTWVDRLMTPMNRAASKRFLKEARYKVWRNSMELSVARRLGPQAYAGRLRELEALCRAKVEDLVRPGKVLVRLAVTGYGVLLGPPTVEGLGNPLGWPRDVLPAFDRYFTCFYATVSRDGHPVTYPLTPYVGEDGRSLDVSCGLTSPAKAERVRSNPKVCLLYADATGSEVDDPPVVLVYGTGAVRDRDLQRNTDRYVHRSIAKLPRPWRGVPRWIMRSLDWYWSRIWVHVFPERIVWWPQRSADAEPSSWEAPAGDRPTSDPAPAGRRPAPWREPAADPLERARHATRHLGLPVLTVVDSEGYPAPLPTIGCDWVGEAFRILLPARVDDIVRAGPACLTFQLHSANFDAYENAVFVGKVVLVDDDVLFHVERSLPDVSLTGSRWRRIRDFAANQKRVKGRVRTEAARRGQRPPLIRIPRYR